MYSLYAVNDNYYHLWGTSHTYRSLICNDKIYDLTLVHVVVLMHSIPTFDTLSLSWLCFNCLNLHHTTHSQAVLNTWTLGSLLYHYSDHHIYTTCTCTKVYTHLCTWSVHLIYITSTYLYPIPHYTLNHIAYRIARNFRGAYNFRGFHELATNNFLLIRIICAIMLKTLKAWLPVSSSSTNIVQRNAFRGHSTKYKCLKISHYNYTYNIVLVVFTVYRVVVKFQSGVFLMSTVKIVTDEH